MTKPHLLRRDLPDFETWFREVLPQVHEVQTLLGAKFSDDPEVLREQMRACESWHSRVNSMLAEAGSQVSMAKLRALEMVGVGKDMEKRIRTEERVSVEQRVHATLEGLAKAIKDRLMLGENLNRHNNEERARHHA